MFMRKAGERVSTEIMWDEQEKTNTGVLRLVSNQKKIVVDHDRREGRRENRLLSNSRRSWSITGVSRGPRGTATVLRAQNSHAVQIIQMKLESGDVGVHL